MKKPDRPAFDKYANSYTDLHSTSIKSSGEEPAFFAAYKANYMASRLGVATASSGPTLLDFGCGIGNATKHLLNAFPGAQLNGADLSSESIRVAEQSHSHEASFRVIENNRLPYVDNSFDIAVAACVFHHIPPPERAHWMDEISRVLKPDGVLFVFEHNVLNPLTLKTVRDCPFDEDAILLPRSELLQLARLNGFKNVHARYIVFFPHMLASLRPLEPAMGWIPFGAQYVVQASAS